MNDMRSPRDHAKLFWTGRSQAVRLPKEFRFDGKEVLIRRDGKRVILEPVADDNGGRIERPVSSMDDDWARAVEEGRPEYVPWVPPLQGSHAVAEAASPAIEWLRSEIALAEQESEDAPFDLKVIKREARARMRR